MDRTVSVSVVVPEQAACTPSAEVAAHKADGGFLGDVSGALADLGILVPIVTALVLVVGFDPGSVFVGVGALYLVAGHWFRVPMPVQPVKAAAAIVIAKGLPAEQLAVAGLVLGVVLLVVATTGLADRLARIFAPSIVRGLQLGVGLLLLQTTTKLLDPRGSSAVLLAVMVAGLMLHQSRRDRPLPIALVFVAGGIMVSLIAGTAITTGSAAPQLWHPVVNAAAFDPAMLWTAFVVLVIPQIPLTFGNAVVGLVDVQRRYFGTRASRVNPSSVGRSMGIANIAVGLFSGMPMCHGAGGFTAHVRAGASTARMNVIIGAPLLVGGLLFGPTLLALLSLVPVGVLAGLLAFTGITHALLVADQRGYSLAVAIAIGLVGFLAANLAWGLALGLALHWGGRVIAPRRPQLPA